MPETLYIVATPIGNLEDITIRAIRILKEVGLIACEDTRHTHILLGHYGIKTPVISYHEHNEHERSADLIARLQSGTSVALVSDAGTPLISDPGYRLVHSALEAGITVSPIPGASAILAALSASGLPTDSFHFGGFLPAKSSQRRKLLEQVCELQSTLVFYETPHRIIEALADIDAVLGTRDVVLTREMTKLHEEFLRGTAQELRAQLESRPSVKGEITLVIGKAEAPVYDATLSLPEAVKGHVGMGLSRMDAIKAVARERGLSKREVYAAVESE